MKDKKKMIEDHKTRMFNIRFMGLDWQEIHQKRWDEDSLCGEDKCDCDEIYHKDKGISLSDESK